MVIIKCFLGKSMKNDDLSTRGSRLRDERKRLGFNNQEDLADILNVKRTQLSVMKSTMQP